MCQKYVFSLDTAIFLYSFGNFYCFKKLFFRISLNLKHMKPEFIDFS